MRRLRENGIIENELCRADEAPPGRRGYDSPPVAETCPECDGMGTRKVWLDPLDFVAMLFGEILKKVSPKG